ncbi:hypothetical protein QZK48_11235 [Acinetobacter baumannii]|nr:hypothetical protein [Acinetobacter baumannii]
MYFPTSNFQLPRQHYNIEKNSKSDITKTTFYKHSLSKEELVFACLKELKLDIEIEVQEHLSERTTPLEKLEQRYHWYINWVNQNGARGCAFHKARMEISDLYPSIQIILE